MNICKLSESRALHQSASCSFQILFLAVFVLATQCGCKDSVDSKVENGLAKVAADRARKPHYPILVISDFGPSNGPEGLDTFVYGAYTEVRTKSDPAKTGIRESIAVQSLAKEYELAVDEATKAQSSNRPPVGSPGGPDWKDALHPPPGTFAIRTSFDGKATTFTVSFPSRSSLSEAQMSAEINETLLADAKSEIKLVEVKEASAIAGGKMPAGFSVCSDELIRARGSHDPDPHLFGLPLLITPFDRAAVLKNLEIGIQAILDKTAKLKSGPATATMLINSPAGSTNKEIDIRNRVAEQQGVAALMLALGSQVDAINRGHP
jgi:hypothetical protein